MYIFAMCNIFVGKKSKQISIGESVSPFYRHILERKVVSSYSIRTKITDNKKPINLEPKRRG